MQGEDSKMEQLASHDLRVVTFHSPRYCDLCGKFIWGLRKQGMHCVHCGVDIHQKCFNACLENVPCQPLDGSSCSHDSVHDQEGQFIAAIQQSDVNYEEELMAQQIDMNMNSGNLGLMTPPQMEKAEVENVALKLAQVAQELQQEEKTSLETVADATSVQSKQEVVVPQSVAQISSVEHQSIDGDNYDSVEPSGQSSTFASTNNTANHSYQNNNNNMAVKRVASSLRSRQSSAPTLVPITETKSADELNTPVVDPIPSAARRRKQSNGLLQSIILRTASKANEMDKVHRGSPKLNVFTTLPRNYFRFTMKVGPLASFQDKIEDLFLWKNQSETIAAWLIFTVLCLNPFLIMFIPHVIMLTVLWNNYFVREQRRARKMQKKHLQADQVVLDKKKKNLKPSSFKPDDIDYKHNMQFIQNTMGMYSDVYEHLRYYNTYIDWSDEWFTMMVLKLTLGSALILALLYKFIAWNFVILGAGSLAFIGNTALGQAIGAQLLSIFDQTNTIGNLDAQLVIQEQTQSAAINNNNSSKKEQKMASRQSSVQSLEDAAIASFVTSYDKPHREQQQQQNRKL
ncbi:hypothetical protein MIR68_002613 [Amoeboaphelidium protococcarum]|nr:hypothetical protein MIR68_002613 [Amoeboaphelidium protococcarum]